MLETPLMLQQLCVHGNSCRRKEGVDGPGAEVPNKGSAQGEQLPPSSLLQLPPSHCLPPVPASHLPSGLPPSRSLGLGVAQPYVPALHTMLSSA